MYDKAVTRDATQNNYDSLHALQSYNQFVSQP